MATLDLAGIITRVCTDLKAKFSKVAVSRSLTSGTKSATVTVDGTAYDLYAPTPPTASTAAPRMDGTASYGSGTYYARSNHVHPTDTSRQATLVSGTNIKTINNESLLGSGNIAISGGVSMSTATVTLTSSGWSGGVQVVNCVGLTQTCNVIISPDPNSVEAWAAAGVKCTGQTPTTLTFIFNNAAPTQNLYANVLILD